MHVLQCWCGKKIDCVLTTHPLQTVIKPSFVANGSESFHVDCFPCWTSPEVILFSGSFHLLQDPGYRVWSLESHTKRSVSAGTWNRQLKNLPVLRQHLPVKTGTCRSSGSSGSPVSHSHAYSTCHRTIYIYRQTEGERETGRDHIQTNRQGDSVHCGSYSTDSSSNFTKPSRCPKSLFS